MEIKAPAKNASPLVVETLQKIKEASATSFYKSTKAQLKKVNV
jgi:hypothetical protein